MLVEESGELSSTSFDWSTPILNTQAIADFLPLGHDATEAFEDIGHSPEADSIMKTLYIGEFKGVSRISAYPFHDSFPVLVHELTRISILGE